MNLDAETYIHNMAEGDLLRRTNTRNALADFLQGNVHRELRRMSRFQVRKSKSVYCILGALPSPSNPSRPSPSTVVALLLYESFPCIHLRQTARHPGAVV